MDPVKKQKMKSATTSILAIIGLIAVLAILSVLIIRSSPGVFRSAREASEKVTNTVTSNAKFQLVSNTYNIQSGQTVLLSWTHNGEEVAGSYAISYPCQNGVYIEIAQRGQKELVFCNTTYRFINENNTLPVTVYNRHSQTAEVALTMNFTRNGSSGITSKADATITVAAGGTAAGSDPNTYYYNSTSTTPTSTGTGTTGGSTGTAATKPKPKPVAPTYQQVIYIPPTTTGGTPVNNPNGKIDLTARIIATGVVDRTTNNFTETSIVNRNEYVGIRFVVENIGDKVSRDWKVNVVLPTYPEAIYHGDLQQPLYPGERTEFVIAFDRVKAESFPSFLINVDPDNYNIESNETNNIIRGNVRVNLNY